MNILILGPQGSGKGTQAKRIAVERGVAHISTGDILRSAIAAGTPLGLQVAPIMASGALVPDHLMVDLIRERLGEPDAAGGFVLDGFPRNLAQADALDAMLHAIGRDVDVILELQLDDETASERLLGRAAEEGRDDDTPEAIERRLEIYHRETEPIVEHYRTTGKLVGIHAERTVGEVYVEIEAALEEAERR